MVITSGSGLLRPNSQSSTVRADRQNRAPKTSVDSPSLARKDLTRFAILDRFFFFGGLPMRE